MTGSRDGPNQVKKFDSSVVHSLFWENARDILLIIRGNGRIIDANRKAVEAYGYGRNELLSLRIHDLRDAVKRNQLLVKIGVAEKELGGERV